MALRDGVAILFQFKGQHLASQCAARVFHKCTDGGTYTAGGVPCGKRGEKNPEDKLLFARGLAGQLQDTIFDTKNTNAGRNL